MQMNRRAFRGTTLAASAAAATRGFGACSCGCGCGQPAQVAVQLYSIHKYIKGKDGLAKALQEVAKIGYKGVEFAGYYGASADELKKMLADAGLVACGTHVGRAEFGPDKIKATCEFNLAYGNSFICCPGGGNFPGKGENLDDFMKMLVDYYNTAAETAATYGCKIGLHNHKGEFERKLSNGQTYWDYFFSQTADNVCMEQDVGWTTAAGRDPCIQYAKYPHRSPTLHAKENGMGSKKLDAILGQPGDGAVGVAWDRLFPVTDADGVKWYVVECERHFDSLMPITESFKFLQSKGRC